MDSEVIMDSDIFHGHLISSCLLIEKYYSNYYSVPIATWEEFINQNDFGLSCKFDKPSCFFTYKIIDKKKWLLTKIKYGL